METVNEDAAPEISYETCPDAGMVNSCEEETATPEDTVNSVPATVRLMELSAVNVPSDSVTEEPS